MILLLQLATNSWSTALKWFVAQSVVNLISSGLALYTSRRKYIWACSIYFKEALYKHYWKWSISTTLNN